jgi:hypothetical protein
VQLPGCALEGKGMAAPPPSPFPAGMNAVPAMGTLRMVEQQRAWATELCGGLSL